MNESFFNTAMSKLKVGTTSQEFAENYANASGEQANTDIWTQYKEEGLKLFNNRIDQGEKDGVVSEDEFKIVGFYIERITGRWERNTNTLEETMNIGGDKNSLIESWENPNPYESEEMPEEVLKEQKGLKPVNTMSEEEINKELQLPENVKERLNIDDKTLLYTKRSNDIIRDENSNVIDMHIGTFAQGSFGDCSALAQITNMSDEEVAEIIKPDKKNEPKVFTVQFPIDKGTDVSVKVTKDEVKSKTLDVNYNGKIYKISGFSEGDETVKIFEIALIKRFGFNIMAEGLNETQAQRIFTYPEQYEKLNIDYKVTEEKLLNMKTHATMHLHNTPTDEDRYDDKFTSESGIKAHWKISASGRKRAMDRLNKLGVDTSRLEHLDDGEFLKEIDIYMGDDFGFTAILALSDGTRIIEGHSYSVKSYDKKTKTVTINDPHLSNEDIKIPLDIAQRYFQISI